MNNNASWSIAQYPSHKTTAETFKERAEWLQLTKHKQFSRLLYSNPVCFLTTTIATSTSSVSSRNAMVLSWLTATNNEGRFMFSLNRRRYTASMFCEEGVEFCLSVPVQGMEAMIKEVGRTSGRFGSKFQHDCHTDLSEFMTPAATTDKPKSNRQKKAFASTCVVGLKAVPFGNDSCSDNESDLFIIDGTVAQLKCKAYQIIKEPLVDNDHYIVFAQVSSAFVLKNYWNPDKNLFQPQESDTPPYLTFFGSQTFGYVYAK